MVLKKHLSRVIYHRIYWNMRRQSLLGGLVTVEHNLLEHLKIRLSLSEYVGNIEGLFLSLSLSLDLSHSLVYSLQGQLDFGRKGLATRDFIGRSGFTNQRP